MEDRQLLKAAGHPAGWDAMQHRILDAAERLIAQRGVRGLAIAELARTAGISRPTVYRSWASADEVVRSTLLRRMLRLLDGIPIAADRPSLVTAVQEFTRAFRSDALYAALLEREPEIFTRYTLHRFGASQRAILGWLSASVSAAQSAGSVRPGDPAHIAVMLLVMTQSAILSHGTVADLISDDAWDDELRAAVDGMLRP
ncbi:TetR/AcrR family transcriptional regulator [Microbacterium sp. NPDC055312]